MNILIIEDHTGFGKMLVDFLKDISTSIALVKSWKEARVYLEKKPDVAIIDLQLADLEPFETISQIQDLRAADAEIVIIVLSGLMTPEMQHVLCRIPVDSIEEKQLQGSHEKLLTMVIMSLMKAIKRGAQGRTQGRLATLMEKATSIAKEILPNFKPQDPQTA